MSYWLLNADQWSILSDSTAKFIARIIFYIYVYIYIYIMRYIQTSSFIFTSYKIGVIYDR